MLERSCECVWGAHWHFGNSTNPPPPPRHFQEKQILQMEAAELKARKDGTPLQPDPQADDAAWAAIEYEYDPLADEHLGEYLHRCVKSPHVSVRLCTRCVCVCVCVCSVLWCILTPLFPPSTHAAMEAQSTRR